MVIRVIEAGLVKLVMSHPPVIQALLMLENKIRAAAAACVRKYFVAASTARGWWLEAKRGIIARVLISKPIQARSQWWLDIVVRVPMPRAEIKQD